MSQLGTSIAFSPLVPLLWLYGLGAAGLILLAAGAWFRAKGLAWRALALAILWLVLANPSFVVEEREPLRDLAVVVLDESPSQDIGERRQRTARALEQVREEIEALGDVDLRVVRAGADPSEEGTQLFGPLERALGEIPRQRLAGVIMVTDGQVHDVPEAGDMPRNLRSFHLLLTGRRGEVDRRLVVENAPAYGLVGRELQMRLRVEDNGAESGARARLTIKRDGEDWRSISVPVNQPVTVDFELDHRGTTFFEVEVEAGEQELTLENNRRIVAVNGVRDRLRVLLISGEPHPGERSWRNLLKSDPAVDLVHFTILRPPEKRDMTPINELALISFPVRELFEEKLEEFDLVIFDRYRRRGVIRQSYLDNIKRYVREGGALLVAVGPSFATQLSLQHTPIGDILPGLAADRVLMEGFRPVRTELGHRHPVTASLRGGGDPERAGADLWGRWFRQIDVTLNTEEANVLMTGAQNRPLLILDRVTDGRIAQFLSDQSWLWDRGFEGGGPQAEMLRRTAHWLMKEPELEENFLRARVRGSRLEVIRRTLRPDDRPVRVTTPSGRTETLEMRPREEGRTIGSMPIGEVGLYRITDGERSAMAAVGALNPVEVEDVRTSADPVRPVVEANGGGIVWMGDDGVPDIRRVDGRGRLSGTAPLTGNPWIGLRRNNDYVVTGIRELPIMVGLLALLLAMIPLLLAWRREGR